MKISSESFKDGSRIPETLTFGKPDSETHVALSQNRNPHLAWSDLPSGTRSLALVCIDPDAPTRPDNVNREGVTVSADLPRADFPHWALVDLSADAAAIAEGEFSHEVTPHGKRGPDGPHGTRQALNGYTQWFAADADMAGNYFGYDGPCPPWNDERVHRYRFTLYALDLERCPVEGEFSVADVLAAIQGHVLAEASITGRYAIYPDAR